MARLIRPRSSPDSSNFPVFFKVGSHVAQVGLELIMSSTRTSDSGCSCLISPSFWGHGHILSCSASSPSFLHATSCVRQRTVRQIAQGEGLPFVDGSVLGAMQFWVVVEKHLCSKKKLTVRYLKTRLLIEAKERFLCMCKRKNTITKQCTLHP